MLSCGAEAWGFRGDLWTCARVAAILRWQFGVHYHKAHVSRLLKQLGWTPQKPKPRATQRDEQAIQDFRQTLWPQLKKAWDEDRNIVFADECGFYPISGVVRTYAPRGDRPILHAS